MNDKDVDFAGLVQGPQQRAVDYSRASGRAGLDLPAFAVKTIDRGKRQIRVLASSDALDRYNERILPEAFKKTIAVFMTNPVVLAAHAHKLSDGQPPVVGSVVKLWIDAKGLWAVIQFAVTELAETYWVLYNGGHMKAVSIGFIPLSFEDGVEEGRRVRVYTEVELLEISLVAVPANPEALVRSGGKGNSFVDHKRQEREEGTLMAEIEAEFPDEECRAFSEALLRGEYDIRDDDGEYEEGNTYGKAISGEAGGVGIEENEFVSLVNGDSACGFADMVRA